jgi:hypothetical protein
LTADDLYKNEAGYRSSLAKIYGALPEGNNGLMETGDWVESTKVFPLICVPIGTCRVSTDEAVIGWNDQTIKISMRWIGLQQKFSIVLCIVAFSTKSHWQMHSSGNLGCKTF